jgi:hypothetical protein
LALDDQVMATTLCVPSRWDSKCIVF